MSIDLPRERCCHACSTRTTIPTCDSNPSSRTAGRFAAHAMYYYYQRGQLVRALFAKNRVLAHSVRGIPSTSLAIQMRVLAARASECEGAASHAKRTTPRQPAQKGLVCWYSYRSYLAPQRRSTSRRSRWQAAPFSCVLLLPSTSPRLRKIDACLRRLPRFFGVSVVVPRSSFH